MVSYQSSSKFTPAHVPTSINEMQDPENDEYYNRNRETIKPPKISMGEEPRSLQSKSTGEFFIDKDDDNNQKVDYHSEDNYDNVQFKIMR